jgi:hypothetical protein
MMEGKLPEPKLPDSEQRRDSRRLRRAGDCARAEPNPQTKSPEAAFDPLPAPGFGFPAGVGLP